MTCVSVPRNAGSSSINTVEKRADALAVRRTVLSLPLWITGCSAAPAQDVLGSFFPAWMLCAAIGILAAVVLRIMLTWVGIAESVPVPPVTYIILATAMTLLVWLLWFGH